MSSHEYLRMFKDKDEMDGQLLEDLMGVTRVMIHKRHFLKILKDVTDVRAACSIKEWRVHSFSDHGDSPEMLYSAILLGSNMVIAEELGQTLENLGMSCNIEDASPSADEIVRSWEMQVTF